MSANVDYFAPTAGATRPPLAPALTDRSKTIEQMTHTYVVRVRSGSINYAGTKAPVFIRFIGKDGKSGASPQQRIVPTT